MRCPNLSQIPDIVRKAIEAIRVSFTDCADDIKYHKSRHATGGADALTAADISAAASVHNHNDIYFTETELGSTTDSSSGGDKIGMTAVSYFSGATVQSIVESIYNAIYEVGHIMVWPWLDLPTNGTWLWLDGRSIGDASSNASALAHANALTLFTKLWTDYDNTTAPIYTSAGVLSTRGASAAADWAAHKQIILAPRTRGRAFIGMDNYNEGGAAANTVTDVNADVLGGIGGEENHALTSAENGQHNHAMNARAYLGGGTGTAANLAVTGSSFVYSGSDNTANSGSGTAHNNMQPWTAVKYIIRY